MLNPESPEYVREEIGVIFKSAEFMFFFISNNLISQSANCKLQPANFCINYRVRFKMSSSDESDLTRHDSEDELVSSSILQPGFDDPECDPYRLVNLAD